MSAETAMKTSSAGVVGACWYLTPERFSERCDQFVTAVIDGAVQRRFVAMKGRLPTTAAADGRAAEWLSGGGPFLDVSAYASAATQLPDDLPLYLILNDTLFEHHPWRLISRRLAQVRDSLAALPSVAAAAEVHPSTDLLLLDAHNPTRRHLSTFCLLLNNAGFRLFRRVLSELPTSAEPEFVDDWIASQTQTYPSLRLLLHVHLSGPASPWSWKAGAAAGDRALLRRKAVTVIFEYLFTVELLANGAGMPINHGLSYRILARMGRYGRPAKSALDVLGPRAMSGET